jgi:hypothetical protein
MDTKLGSELSTKAGLILLIVGSYLLALGVGGVNATSGGVQAFWAVVLAVGFVMAGWAVVLPWNGATAGKERHEAPGPVPLSKG